MQKMFFEANMQQKDLKIKIEKKIQKRLFGQKIVIKSEFEKNGP